MKITITTGTGSGPTALAAFDAALLQSGVGNYNLIPLSSVIPPSSELQQGCYIAPVSEFGHRLYVVISSQQATEPGAEAWAGLGWVQDTSGKGLFVEHHGLNEAGVSQDIHRSLSAMVANRSHDQYGSICSRLVGITCEKQPVCAVVIAVYENQGWQLGGIAL